MAAKADAPDRTLCALTSCVTYTVSGRKSGTE